MSGLKAILTTLCAVILLPLKRASLLRYAVSGEILWHEDNVGFASLLYEAADRYTVDPVTTKFI